MHTRANTRDRCVFSSFIMDVSGINLKFLHAPYGAASLWIVSLSVTSDVAGTLIIFREDKVVLDSKAQGKSYCPLHSRV